MTKLANILCPVSVDTSHPPGGWADGALTPGSFDLLLCINMIHISEWAATEVRQSSFSSFPALENQINLLSFVLFLYHHYGLFIDSDYFFYVNRAFLKAAESTLKRAVYWLRTG